eukprot:Platyproteum_vivax@DN5191_c0_g1_i1.p1
MRDPFSIFALFFFFSCENFRASAISLKKRAVQQANLVQNIAPSLGERLMAVDEKSGMWENEALDCKKMHFRCVEGFEAPETVDSPLKNYSPRTDYESRSYGRYELAEELHTSPLEINQVPFKFRLSACSSCEIACNAEAPEAGQNHLATQCAVTGNCLTKQYMCIGARGRAEQGEVRDLDAQIHRNVVEKRTDYEKETCKTCVEDCGHFNKIEAIPSKCMEQLQTASSACLMENHSGMAYSGCIAASAEEKAASSKEKAASTKEEE